MKKEIRIYALPTNKASDIGYQLSNKGKKEVVYEKNTYGSFQNHLQYIHLYATTDETIKEGDWCIERKIDLVLWSSDLTKNTASYYDECRKVVATTDNNISLNLGKEYHESPIKGGQLYTRLSPLPQISPEFQQAWVKAMNKGNPIVDALMEFEEITPMEENLNEITKKELFITKPKLNFQGYVTILPKVEKNNCVVDLPYKGKRVVINNLTQEHAEILNEVFGVYNTTEIRKNAVVEKGYNIQDIMEYYMKYCQENGYVTPMDWLNKYKHY